ncbi:MAG: segregation/condensation protein A [Candidatus Omnitrophica bacterium]|nr:segregation/condensation protein A [Candidatus Omnitrophota bacterium]
MNYKLKLDIFEGPLDLLLYLIKKDDIDISNIPISRITEQYMQYIEMMKILNLDMVGDFLVMAATLMQIKSRMLLPPDPVADGEVPIDPRDELARRLAEYQRFKEIADELKEKEADRRNLFSREIGEDASRQIREDAKEIYFEASLFDLINALSDALKRTPEEVLHEIIQEEFTVEQKIHEVLHLLLEKDAVTLTEIFSRSRSKIEVIVTFLAVLELIRLKEIKAVQKELFAEIEVLRNKDNLAPIPFEPDQNQEHNEL